MQEDLYEKVFQDIIAKQGVFIGSKWYSREVDILTAVTIVLMEAKEEDGPSWESVEELSGRFVEIVGEYDLGSVFMALRTFLSIITTDYQIFLDEHGAGNLFLEKWFDSLTKRGEEH
jgi:hypothetical protein